MLKDQDKTRKKADRIARDVKSYCEGNEDFAKILDLFSAGYIPTYNKRKVKQRKEVQTFLKHNFFTWYYSAVNQVSDISPAHFISSHIFNKFGEDVAVIPIPEPVYNKSKLQNINYVYRIFTMDEHPLIQDIKYLTDAAGPTGVSDQAEFAFGNAHYVSFLFNICTEVGIIVENEDEIKLNEKKLAAYSSLSGKEKLNKLLSAHLSHFLGNLKKQKYGKLPSLAKLLRILGTRQDIDSFYSSAFPGFMSKVINFTTPFELMELDDMETYLEDEESMIEMMGSTFEIQMLISNISSAIFICCGLYFHLIQVEYDSYFDFSELDDSFLGSLPPDDSELSEIESEEYASMISFIAYIKPPSSFSLTPIGAKLLGKNYTEEFSHLLINQEDYDEVLEDMLLDRDEIEEDIDDDLLENIFGGGLMQFINKANNADVLDDDKIIQFPSLKSPLNGLNPDNKPTFTDENATYRFKVSRRVITINGNDTLTDLGRTIEYVFDLEGDHLSSFYMGKKFFENSREIRCPDPFGENGESDDYRICDLGLFKGQTFLYVFDFGNERRFTLKFDGC